MDSGQRRKELSALKRIWRRVPFSPREWTEGKPARWGTEWMLPYPNLVKKKKQSVSCHLPFVTCCLQDVDCNCIHFHVEPWKEEGQSIQGTRRRQANLRTSLLSSKWVVERTLNWVISNLSGPFELHEMFSKMLSLFLRVFPAKLRAPGKVIVSPITVQALCLV